MATDEAVNKLLEELAKFKQPMNLASVSKRIRLLAWGIEGVGKTTLFAKLIEALDTGEGQIFVVHTDPGWDVLLDHLPVSKRERVQLIPYQGLKHVRTIITCINNGLPGYENVEFFALDTISGMTEAFLDGLVENSSYEHRNQIRLVNQFDGYKPNERLQVAHWNDYHLLRNRIRPIIKELVGMDMHVFLTAHVNEDDKGKLTPSMPDSCLKVVAREVSLVGYMKRDFRSGERTISLSVSDMVRAKSRIAALDGKTLSIDNFVAEVKNWSNS